jgi:CRISPR-associated protein Csh1
MIVFKKIDQKVEFDRVDVEEFTKEKLEKYAYKHGSSRGGDITPTSKITKIEKTYDNIKKPLNKICSRISTKSDFSENEKIILEINEILQNEPVNGNVYSELIKIKYDKSAVLTIVYDTGDGLKYVGDFPELIEDMIIESEKKYYSKYEKESLGTNNLCYICSKPSEKTYGFVGTYEFYTLDKPGFVSGGFNQEDAWKNYPVCPECAKILDLGRNYVEEKLSNNFCNFNYSIIPKPIFEMDDNKSEEFFEINFEKYRLSLNQKKIQKLTNSEEDLFSLMSESSNFMNFNMLFYEKDNSAFRILLYVEDVSPSHIKKIYESKNAVERFDIFKNLKKDKEVYDLEFKLDLLSKFFYTWAPKNSDTKTHKKQFLEIINSIFTGSKISYQFLMRRFAEHFQNQFKNDYFLKEDVLSALMILKFLKRLNLLNSNSNVACGGISLESSEYNKMVLGYFNEHSDIFDTNPKKLSFLMGVLCQKLLNVQHAKRKSQPFKARLNGLKLDEKILKRLYPEIINKLEEYDSNYYKKLEQIISEYIINTNFNGFSNNEISFYFVTGMNQEWKFKFEKNNEDEKGDSNGQ